MCYKEVIDIIIIKIKRDNLKYGLSWIAIDSMSDTSVKIGISCNLIITYSCYERISDIYQEHRCKSLCRFSNSLSCSKIANIFKWGSESYTKSFVITILQRCICIVLFKERECFCQGDSFISIGRSLGKEDMHINILCIKDTCASCCLCKEGIVRSFDDHMSHNSIVVYNIP